MEANDYQKSAHDFAMYKDGLYPILGLAEKSGEAAGNVAKNFNVVYLRVVGRLNAHAPDVPFSESLKSEIGDICWLVAEICTMYGWTLSEVMEQNIAKLTDRMERGVIA